MDSYEKSPADESYRKAREAAAKGVRRVTETSTKIGERADIAKERGTETLHKTGETTRELGGTAVDEARKTREELKGDSE